MIYIGFIVVGWLACRIWFYFTVERDMRKMAKDTREFLAAHPLN